MRPHVPLTIAGLGLCAALGLALLRARDESRTLTAEYDHLAASSSQEKAEVERLQKKSAEAKSETLRRRQVALAAVSSADRARATVGPLIARIKADHAAHPLPPRPAPVPVPPTGVFFPELMSDPEYNLAVKESIRLRMAEWYQAKLQSLGLTAAETDRVLDLLAEHDMVREDFASLRKDLRSGPSTEFEAQHAAEDKILQQIKEVVGAERFGQLTVEAKIPRTTLNADGTLTRSTTTRLEMRPPDINRAGRFSSLELRLSYSAEPLTPEQIDRLGKHSEQNPTVRGFPDELRALLTPLQQTAVEELRIEQEAGMKRSRLPNPSAPQRK